MRMMTEWLTRLLLALLVFAPLLSSAAPVEATPTPTAYYTVTELGSLDNGSSFSYGINDDGVAVGISTFTYKQYISSRRAVRWQGGQPVNLGTLSGVGSGANAINARGDIVGSGEIAGRETHAMLVDARGTHDLGTLGGPYSEATAINANGVIVGGSDLSDAMGDLGSFVYRDGTMTALGTYNGARIYGPTINDNDQIAATTSDNRLLLIDANGTRDLGVGQAKAINNRGTIVGSNVNNQSRAFSYRDGRLTDLGTLPGYAQSDALDVNEAGQTVGSVNDFATSRDNRAVFFGGSAVLDLNTLIPRDSGWTLRIAHGINNRGQIVGDGLHNGQFRAFLLTPRFPDVAPNSPYFDAIVALTNRGIIQGYADGRFGPADLVLRAQSAALIARAAGWDAEDWPDATFPDRGPIDDDLWRNVRTLAHYGVAQGYADGTYDPTGPVLHQQAILFITRALVEKGFWTLADDTAPYPNLPNGTARERADRRAIATYVREAGAIPDRPVGQPWADWSTPASRGWYAQVLYQALATLPSTQPIP